ncbi:MAG: bifunctional metallophosphatase/5'-nucleotidase [Deltaproteobacteria bacterium]|nr:bifunctional metallophosphatase/5'-nucleotidase [Deltaproteobacteria bacterium]
MKLLLVAVLSSLSSCAAFGAQIPLTILHTNDLHSHYRPDQGAFGLGGLARLATYDVVTIGNHDWLNGPDQMLKLFKQVQPRFPIVAANLEVSKYNRKDEFGKYVMPYTSIKVGGVKIAFIGLVTYELIYDRYFAPVEIKDPFGLTRKLAAKLKADNDLVVVISHNGMSTNKLIAGLPNVDIVIHSHDHEKLAQPVVVERNGKTSIMVEAQHWGFYLGKLELLFDTETKKYSVKHYELIQQDETIPEDPAFVSLVNSYDLELTKKYGDIFHDHLADSQIDVRRESAENLYGNLLTDAYREYTGADVSFEQMALTSNILHAGPIHTVDLYNALTAIWSPFTDKAWTLKTMRMSGETLSWVMNFVLSASSYIPGGLLSVSGLHAVYDPMAVKSSQHVKLGHLSDDEKHPLKMLEIGGRPVDPKRQYLVAVPEGINQAIDFLEKFWGNKIERTDVRDTGVEDWRVLSAYVQKHSPLTSALIGRGGRLSVLQSDLAIYADEVATTRGGAQIWASVLVRNLGTSESPARTLKVSYDKTPTDTRDDPNPAETDAAYTVPPIPAGGHVTMKVALTAPAGLEKAQLPVYFILNNDASDPNKSNDGTWVVVGRDGRARSPGGTKFKLAAVSARLFSQGHRHDEQD